MCCFRHPWLKVLYWVVAEVLLNLIGFDDIADYSEFILHQRAIYSEVMLVEQSNKTHQPVTSVPILPTRTLSRSHHILI